MPKILSVWTLTLAGVSVSGLFAADKPIGRAISKDEFSIDGVTAPARNYVPVSVGTAVSTSAASAVLQFRDKTHVVLQPNSEARIISEVPHVKMIRGTALFGKEADQVAAVGPNSAGSGSGWLGSHLTAAAGSVAGGAAIAAASLLGKGSSAAPAASAPAVMVSGTGATGASLVGSLDASSTGSTAQIITPSGLTFTLAATTNPTTGVVTYTIASVSETVTNPVTGQTVTVSVSSATQSSLIGASVTGISPTTSNGTQVAVSITPPGSTTPLTPTALATSVQTSVQTAVNTAVSNGTLPTGTTAPTPSPVTTATFSSDAP